MNNKGTQRMERIGWKKMLSNFGSVSAKNVEYRADNLAWENPCSQALRPLHVYNNKDL